MLCTKRILILTFRCFFSEFIVHGEKCNIFIGKLKYGSDCYHSLSQPLEEVCKDLQCSKDHYILTSHPALEGTTCGANKVGIFNTVNVINVRRLNSVGENYKRHK